MQYGKGNYYHIHLLCNYFPLGVSIGKIFIIYLSHGFHIAVRLLSFGSQTHETQITHTMLSVPPIFYHILIYSTICYSNCTEPPQHGIYLFYIIQKQMSIAMSSMCLSSYRS